MQNYQQNKQNKKNADETLYNILKKQMDSLLSTYRPVFGSPDAIQVNELLGKINISKTTIEEKNRHMSTIIYRIKTK